ncbi:flagellar biosynthesis protein FlgK [Methylobacterium sp. Leaf399]|uniref:flagellar hook-associated protein FlgK n=1 Tax=unclassified Methylobacterium TaxID=2615210 RepID=UPI0006FF295B|nr:MULTISPECIES: flagellar hook-associated protein FlgK [unclassified Methylobacterium]KQT19778.1 flagellar biosynthesis protein FlgK [Methylobacterium sp. Leaf399]KQT80828.1 flagellar biosynthesis protein FlgK [Methylobacterium sp. Leaf466]
MGLSLALNNARASLSATSSQIAAASRNTTGADDPNYSRKIATLVTGGGTTAVVIQRATDDALFARKLLSTSDAAAAGAVSAGLDSLSRTVGDTDDPTSPAARLGSLNAALQAAANRPDDGQLAREAVESARDLALSLNAAADAVHTVRADADTALGASVTRINDLLSQFAVANGAVTRGSANGADVTDALDDRDRILGALSEEIGITTVSRPGDDMAIYTDSGVPLFDRTARRVTFAETVGFTAGTVGNSVMADGVPVTGANSPMPVQSGRIAGLAALRDTVAVRYESQLDAMAGALVDAFAETGDLGAGPVRRAGLFSDGTSGLVPGGAASATLGLAAAIRINAAVDPRTGGSLDTLRDGGMNGPAFRANPGTEAGFDGRLRDLASALGTARAFDPGTQITGVLTLQSFAAASAGWLSNERKLATSEADYQSTLLSRAGEAYSNAVGVNVDDETARILQLEQSYTASARLISVVDQLLKTLMDVVR